MTQAQAQEASWRVAHEWHNGVDLNCGGVNLGDALAYEFMRVMGALLLKQIRGDGDGRTEQQPASAG